MNCRDCQENVQKLLDGVESPSAELRDHVRECSACRRDLAAAQMLLGGLSRLPKPEASPLMSATIAAAVRTDRQARRRRSAYRWYATSSLAACLLLLAGMGWLAPLWKSPVPPVALNQESSAVELAQSAGDAQKAVASLTKSVRENTQLRFNALLPDAETIEKNMPLRDFEEPLDPAALKQAGLRVAQSLDPITQTTARAFGFFAREMPVLDFSKN
jgi:hypothetical protein